MFVAFLLALSTFFCFSFTNYISHIAVSIFFIMNIKYIHTNGMFLSKKRKFNLYADKKETGKIMITFNAKSKEKIN